MKTPTLEEVKEYFKNAKEVRCLFSKEIKPLIHKVSDNGKIVFNDCFGDIWMNSSPEKNAEVWTRENGYAEIISYKDTYTVSKDFILEAHKDACDPLKNKIENQFPELFPKVELELNKWYKMNEYLFNYQGIEENSVVGYGFDLKPYPNNDIEYFEQCRIFCLDFKKQIEQATKEEVETALIDEANKRGFKDGVKFIPLFEDGKPYYSEHIYKSEKLILNYKEEKNTISFINGREDCWLRVFANGKWSEIISEPIEISLDEIAEKFGVDVSLIKIKK